MCGPFGLRGPVVLCGPKVPSLFFIISIKMSKPSLKKKNKHVFFHCISCHYTKEDQSFQKLVCVCKMHYSVIIIRRNQTIHFDIMSLTYV